jgi:uncharacterized protein
MKIVDPIYGSFKIDESVLIELIESPSMQRLKRISQLGLPDRYYNKKGFSRFDHSIGVFLVLRQLGANMEEQVAGLLHDISHTAFSHLIDWVIGDSTKEDFQDKNHLSFLQKSEIPDILSRADFDVKNIANHHRYKLLEREAPEICADRLDYALREFPLEISETLAKKISVNDNTVLFNDLASAQIFATRYLAQQKTHWGGYEAVSRYTLFADALQKALDLKLIDREDFWKDDEWILERLENCDDESIQKCLAILRNSSLMSYKTSDTPSAKKFRYVDPLFLSNNGNTIRLSSVDPSFADQISAAKQENALGVFAIDVDAALEG